MSTGLRFATFALLALSVSSHMWLDAPVSRRGTGNIGGRTGPCNNMAPGIGARTTYTAGQKVSLKFRINKHGPGPFRLSFSPTGDDQGYDNPKNILANNFFFKTNAPADGSDPFQLKFTIPDTPCAVCSIQLKGMASSTGANPWYQCADIKIDPVPCSVANCNPRGGACNTTGSNCVCNTGFTGSSCSLREAPAKADGSKGGVTMGVWVNTSGTAVFDRTAFAAAITSSLAIQSGRAKVSSVVSRGNQILVVITIAPPMAGAAATEPTATEAVQNLQSQYANSQLQTAGFAVAGLDPSAPITTATPGNTNGAAGTSSSLLSSLLLAAAASLALTRHNFLA